MKKIGTGCLSNVNSKINVYIYIYIRKTVDISGREEVYWMGRKLTEVQKI